MHLLHIPRHACTPRDTARAADLWRLVQEAAVLDSAERGWPPVRYREAGTGFVVRDMAVVHRREAVYGEALRARTWIAETRRDMLMRRETELEGVLRASAEWVHIGPEGGPARAPRTLVEAFGIVPDGGPGAVLPEFDEEARDALPPFAIVPWWTEMDPLAHVNHPRYLDWAEEALAVWLAGRGVDPIRVVPVAERIRFRAAAVAGDRVELTGERVGRVGDAAVFRLRARRGEGVLCEATLVRAHLDGPGALGLA